MSSEGTTPLREVRAEDLVRELTRGWGKQFSQLRLGKGVLPLRNAKIVGKFDLKHCTVKDPVDIQDCEFAGEVDLRYCEFQQVVDFSGCTFHKEFNSGDQIESHTIYRKDLICNRSHFNEAARFNGTRVEGSVYFLNAIFLDQDFSVDFEMALVEKRLRCDGATFEGPVSFRALTCKGYGALSNASFMGQRQADFTEAFFGVDLLCDQVTFEGGAIFDRVRCEGYGRFQNATFGGEGVSFANASFGDLYYEQVTVHNRANFNSLRCSNFDCYEVTFEGGAIFDRVRCEGYGRFQNAAFRGEGVSFANASFSDLYYQRVLVYGLANFNSLRCGNLYCNEVSFKEAVNFNLVECSNLLCGGALFDGQASFDRLKCEGVGQFANALFHSLEVSFTSAYFGTNLVLHGAIFNGSIDLSEARISQDLILTGAQFKEPVSFNTASIDALELGLDDRFPFAEGSVDLRQCTINTFRGSPEQARRLAAVQDPHKFSRDPYLQLEKYYDRAGYGIAARETFYQGRYALRENAKAENGSTQWPTQRMWGDLLLKWLTGYGVGVNRLLIPLVFFVLVGTLVFWPAKALEPVSSTSTPGTPRTSDAPRPPTEELDSNEPVRHLWDRAGYSLDLLVPSGGVLGISFFDLGFESKWSPNGIPYQAYAMVHRVAGWFLILLLIGVLTGVVKRW